MTHDKPIDRAAASGFTRPNIGKVWRRSACTEECRNVQSEHPGTDRVGDIRRCEHGRIYRCSRVWRMNSLGAAYPAFDHAEWARIYPLLRPFLYRRAIRALSEPPIPGI